MERVHRSARRILVLAAGDDLEYYQFLYNVDM
jgi:hypothetical protein